MKKVFSAFGFLFLLSCNNSADSAKPATNHTGLSDSVTKQGGQPHDTVAKDLDNTSNVPGGDSSTPVQ